jgi:hypothetical protein
MSRLVGTGLLLILGLALLTGQDPLELLEGLSSTQVSVDSGSRSKMLSSIAALAVDSETSSPPGLDQRLSTPHTQQHGRN